MIYLIPTPLGENKGELPQLNGEIIKGINLFVVENVRTARRFISSLKLGIDISSLEFYELSEHTTQGELEQIMAMVIAHNGECGLMSEAGLPCVADPGARLVALAHQKGVEVRPLVGPSSIMLALMGSGLSGQSFAFNGYLPIKEPMRTSALKKAISAANSGQSQIYIETPYRNNNIMESLLKSLPDGMKIVVAQGLMCENQKIQVRTVAQWKSLKAVLPKEPAIFIFGKDS